jgi:5-methyltetrahydrofolate--homocysteine methyltransferase
VRGLIDGGSELLLIETIFDTLNAKAAIFGDGGGFSREGVKLPVMISGTITDLSGRTLSGQTVEAFWNAVRHAEAVYRRPQLRARCREMRAHIKDMSRVAGTWSAPIPMPACPTHSASMTSGRRRWRADAGRVRRAGFVNIVGGCCGTTPEHIRSHRGGGRAARRRAPCPKPKPLSAAFGARAVHARRRPFRS